MRLPRRFALTPIALRPIAWVGRSLGRRFVVTSLAVLLVVQLASFIVIDASMRRHAHAAVPAQLAMGTRTLHSMIGWRGERLIEGARLLAADYGFRDAVHSNDTDTIASVLANHGARIGATEVALLAPDLAPVAIAEGTAWHSMATGATLGQLAARAARAGGASEIAVVGSTPRQVVLVPMMAPRLTGWVLMYFPLTAGVAHEVHELSAANLTLLARVDPQQPWAVAFSDLPAAEARALAQQTWRAASETALTEVDIDGARLGVRATPLTSTLTSASGSLTIDDATALAVVSVSIDAALQPPRDLQFALLATTLLGFVAFGIASAWTARRVTTPLQALAGSVERLGAGGTSAPIVDGGTRDEVGDLARAFEQMRASLAAKQEQMLQSEKLASIGQLAAGVAHEINNPIGFVFSNFGTLEGYLVSLFRMLAAYREEEAALAGTPAAQRLARLRSEIELDYLAEDIPALMTESKDGIRRVRKIVQDLKDFSHVDARREWASVDLHDGLDSTLNIVANEIRYKAEVIKAYGVLPLVECLPHELNQVFMNLLVNASHAIGAARGTITLRTGVSGDEAFVDVEDDGHGIPPADLKRIFDPFFTTKPVGKGTGLGLSLAYGVIKAHAGRIEVESEVGRGTRFRVVIPLRRPASVG